MAWFQQNVRAFCEQYFRLGFIKTHFIVVPATAFQKEAIDVSTVIGFEVRCIFNKLEIIKNFVDRDSIPSGKVLKHTREETLSEEEARNPKDYRITHIYPFLEE